MLTRVFVTGTDTAVGKTVVSRALLQALSQNGRTAVGYKPVATESKETPEGLRNQDALILQASSSIEVDYQEVNPYPLAGDVIHACSDTLINYHKMTEGLLRLSTKADTVVVEGCGGWKVMMNDQRFYSDWVIQEQLPVILVVGIKLGCINHALLTAQAILNDGLPLLGWVANRINPGLAHYAETIAMLRERLPAPQLGQLPYLPHAEQKPLAKYLDLTAIAQ
ncbi:dethiobiotin synthase [Yersinia enterocolitica]|uniref:ATP-dependent dethiobiotin synthetase BioD n=2 Tax=Yersinia enterocolitica TaxID=630 RepID=A0A9P1PXH9_YEREN|nr:MULTISPECIES: dethiobiotin synthase [Yersinia]AKF38191.1 dethiobiotin synthetase [Yersinia enterocolitica]ALG45222.1 dethiobiotin synthetase [Yersinia enterocolitica]EKN3337708.1 ATP-dependent dethiobiotin synthetase BioD [Yersinia enterocolitica]EKN3340547.1 ATP-dependent dethiobiotin synthetase BioD [Yersinia enterocolitica]EKN3341317.1 ATP-dependent dethiobiotin synthetase BioD [Yersinia enterocolitica]